MRVEVSTLISVIVPVYNVEKYLPQCIESVLNQSYTNFEIILVNDGSTDSSYEICISLQYIDSRIQVINKNNEGVGSARNDGLKISKGKYLCFLDSDDFLEWDTFESLSPYFQEEPDIIQFGFNRVNESGDYLNKVLPPGSSIKNLKEDKEGLAKILRSGLGLAVWDKLIKREAIVYHDLSFDKKKRGQDFTFIISVFSKVTSIISVQKAFLNYRILLGKQFKFDDQIIVNHVTNFVKLQNLLGVDGKEAKKYLCQIFNIWFFRVVPLHIAGNRYLSISQKQLMLNQMFNNQILITFLYRQYRSKSFVDAVLKNIFLNKRSLILLAYGKIIELVRILKYK